MLAGCAGNQAAVDPQGITSLPGWQTLDMSRAVAAYAAHCQAQTSTCADARIVPRGDPTAARQFLQSRFTAHQVEASDGDTSGLFTGYYEAEILASPTRQPEYDFPVYGNPPSMSSRAYTRAEIDAGALAGSAPVLAWAADPVELFFLQVQGSGVMRFADGTRHRIAFAGTNGQPYKAIGKTLVEMGALDPASVTAASIKAWLHDHPAQVTRVLESNPCYVFFKASSGDAPVGSAGHPLIPGVSMAVDPASIPLGSLVYVDSNGTQPFRGLTIADDTGAAIKGAVRGDIYLGAGDAAEARAGAMKNTGRCWILTPAML